MRFRAYVAGELVDEVWLDVTNPEVAQQVDHVRDRHLGIAARAERAGQVWLVEVFDPAVSPDRAHQRFGTDMDGMTEPRVPRLHPCDGVTSGVIVDHHPGHVWHDESTWLRCPGLPPGWTEPEAQQIRGTGSENTG